MQDMEKGDHLVPRRRRPSLQTRPAPTNTMKRRRRQHQHKRPTTKRPIHLIRPKSSPKHPHTASKPTFCCEARRAGRHRHADAKLRDRDLNVKVCGRLQVLPDRRRQLPLHPDLVDGCAGPLERAHEGVIAVDLLSGLQRCTVDLMDM